MQPDRGIVCTYRRSDNPSTIPDDQNTLTRQSSDTDDAPRDPLHVPVTDPVKWEKVVSIIQAAFRGGEIVASCPRKTVVMIPKGGGNEFRGIGLAEVLRKAISGIINRRILYFIQFHDALHGFRAGRGTGTTTLEDKLHQHLITMRDTVIHSISLDLCKAYDTLDRDRCLDIMVGYGVGPRTLRTLQTYWSQLHMTAKAGGHYGPAFRIHHGVSQG